MMGMVRAGIVVFPLSPRFSPHVLGYLLAQNDVLHVLVSTEEHINTLASDAIKDAQRRKPSLLPRIHPMPTFKILYTKVDEASSLPPRAVDMSATSFIVHSSC